MKKSLKVSVVIPVHNEKENLPPLLQKMLREKFIKKGEIIVVNDNSKDETGQIAEYYSKKYPTVKVVHRSKGNNGMGAALRDGTRAAKGRYVVWVMGDNSDDLSVIPEFIRKLEAGADIVLGSRYIKGGSSGDLSLLKTMLSASYTLIARVMYDIQVHDITNAFRGFRKEIFWEVAPRSDDFSISPEFAIMAHRKGYKLEEVPTTYKNRKVGQEKFKIMKMGIAYGKLLWNCFGEGERKRW